MFYIKEAWRNLRFAGITSVITFFSLLLASGFTVTSYLVSNFSDALSAELTKNVTATFFLTDSLDAEAGDKIVKTIKGMDGVKQVRFISAAEAEKEFVATTGEDFRKVLTYNPLPASILVTLDPAGGEMAVLDKTVEHISRMPGISGHEFRSKMLQEIIDFTEKVRVVTLGITVLFLLLALYLAYTSIRSAFEARGEDLNTMRLVGGSLFKIKFPAYIGSFSLGVVCALITFLIYTIVVNLQIEFLGISVAETAGGLGAVLSLGAAPLIAVIGTYLASFSLKIELRNH